MASAATLVFRLGVRPKRPKKSFEVWCASHSAPSVTNSIHDPRVTGRTDAYREEASVDVVTWLLSRGKQRHGPAVQGNATPWYCQTAGDLNDVPASPVGYRRKLLAAFTALRSDIGLVPVG